MGDQEGNSRESADRSPRQATRQAWEKRLQDLVERARRLDHQAEASMNRILQDREHVIRARDHFLESVHKLAYFASEQAARQAAAPFDAWIEAEKRIAPAVEHYSRLLSEAALSKTGWNLGYDEAVSRVQKLYAPDQQLEKMRDLAYYTWWSTGRNAADLIHFWFGYESDTQNVPEDLLRRMIATAQSSRPEIPAEDENGGLPYDQFSPVRFVERLTELAYCMWDYNGRRAGTTLLDFWAQAESHLSAVLIAALRDASSAVDVGRQIAKALKDFSPQAHMRRIQDAAYALWLQAGQPVDRQLDYWIAAEKQELDRLRGQSAMFEQGAQREK